MKSLFYAGVAVLAMAGAASAADLTVVEETVEVTVTPAFNWTGFYAGVHAGGGWADYNASFNGNQQFQKTGSGALGGVQVGYNYQINQFVIGAQTDMAYTGIQASATAPTGLDVKGETHWLGTTTVRAGYAADTWLFYAKGGLAYAETEANFRIFSQSGWNTGWVAGAGIEKAFTPHVTGFLEYNYLDLGDLDVDTSKGSASVSQSFNTVKVGINYKF